MTDVMISAKRALAALFSLRQRSGPRDLILLYHSVGESPVAVSSRAFADQMAWLHEAANVVPLSELLETAGRGDLRVAITFDDGYRSLHTDVLPIFRGTRAAPAAFLCTGWIGDRDRRLSAPERGHYPAEEFLLWREIEELAAAGWEIGSHGVDHLDLTVQPDDAVKEELKNSRDRIVEGLGTYLPVFAFTWGRHTARLRRLVAEAGYSYALAGVHGPLGKACDRFAIPRIDIAPNYSLSDFKAIVRGDWDYLGWYQQAKLKWRAGK